jgi:hypothetical protein
MVASTGPDQKQQRVSPWVVAFVVFHVVVTVLYALPKPNEQVMNGKAQARGSDHLLKFNQEVVKMNPLVYGYLYPSGMWQYWDMFSPDPAQVDYWGDAEVFFRDGTTTVFAYPRMFTSPLGEKYLTERYRKFYERAHDEKYPFIWPYFAQRIASLSAFDANNPPVRVYLRRHFQDLRNTHLRPQAKLPEYSMYRYFEYSVDLQKLYRDKKWQPLKEWARGRR